jgi:monoamine oxidase
VSISRRALIHGVGRAGGVAAAYQTMAAMGLLPAPAYAGPPVLAPGAGRKIIVLGAGIAGMVAALELGRAGYACRVLEARGRPGGRNWSLRAGDFVQETHTAQRVEWDVGAHMYFNPGPARLPFHHGGILSYCRELGVALEVMCNDNRGALTQDDGAFDGEPQRNGAVITDARGYIAELAGKAIDRAGLDQPVSPEEQEKLRDFLRSFGALDRDLAYRGSNRGGYAEPPGGGEAAGVVRKPLDLRRLLQSDFWQMPTLFGEFYTQAATMMQPVGGMGRIGEAFGQKLENVITYNAEVTQLRRSDDAAKVVWRDRRTGRMHAWHAERVICTLPCPVLRQIEADFSPEVKTALAAPAYVPAGKIAFQASRRFWELDEQIYGGISWTSRDITQIWYPSAGLHAEKGILLGAYIWSEDIGKRFAAKSPEVRAADALDDGTRLHRQYRECLGQGISVAWPNVPYTLGGWAEWDRTGRKDAYPVLLRGDGPFLFAGEHMSYVTGWQEGAVLSAHHAIRQIF